MEKNNLPIEENLCIICGNFFTAGSILLNKQLKNFLDPKTLKGYGHCLACEKKLDENYVAFIEIDLERSNVTNEHNIKAKDVCRTGRTGWIQKTTAEQLFDVPVETMFFIDRGAFEKLIQMPETVQ